MKLSQGPECILNASLGYPNSNPERHLWGKQHCRKRGWFWEERNRPHLTAPPQGLRPSTKFSSIGTTAPINHPSPGVGWHQGRRPSGRQEAWILASARPESLGSFLSLGLATVIVAQHLSSARLCASTLYMDDTAS